MLSLNNWIPFRIKIIDRQLYFEWLYLSDADFNDPFFEETIAGCMCHPFNSSRFRSLSSVDSFLEWADYFPSRNPDAFIFHVSRCGSTLLSQLFGTDPGCCVLAEVPLFDEILRLPSECMDGSESRRQQILKALINCIAGTRNKNRLIIKLDSWHVFYHHFFRDAFPVVPFVLLYRAPAEIILSHRKQRGMQMVPHFLSAESIACKEEDLAGISLDDYTALVLTAYLNEFLHIHEKDSNSLLVNYSLGAMYIMQLLNVRLLFNWSQEQQDRMEERSRFHSKRPGLDFREDRELLTDDYLTKPQDAYLRLEKAMQLSDD